MCDTSWIHEQAFRDAVKTVRGDVPLNEALLHGRSTMNKLQILVAHGVINQDQAQEIHEQKQAETVRLVKEHVKVDPQKQEMLRFLRQDGLIIALVSNCIRSTVQAILTELGCLEFFDYIVSNEDVSEPKPSPEGYLKVMNHFRAMPTETLIVEDSEVGFSAALASGANAMRVNNSGQVTYERVACRL